MQFSKALIREFKTYFNKRYLVKLSDIEANRYLEKLGGLGLVALDILAPKSLSPAASLADMGHGAAAADSEAEDSGTGSGGTLSVAQCPQSALNDLGLD